MARIELTYGTSIKQARTALRRSGAGFRLTMRYGRIYTFKKFTCQQPNTPAQLAARQRLKEATRLANIDMANPTKAAFWQQQKLKTGHKTAIGCAKSYYINLLKAKQTIQNTRTKQQVNTLPLVDNQSFIFKKRYLPIDTRTCHTKKNHYICFKHHFTINSP